MLCKAFFKIIDRPGALGGLDRVASLRREPGDEFVWLGEGKKPGEDIVYGTITVGKRQLVLESNSEKRLRAGKKMLRAVLGATVKHQLDTSQDPFQAVESLKERTAAREPDPIPPGGADQFLKEVMDRHYRQWLDDRLPALAGRTPRQAVRTKTGRRQVADLLKSMENTEEAKKWRGEPGYNFSWLWRELKLTPED